MDGIIRKRDWVYPFVLFIAVVLIFTPLTFSETHYKSGVVTSDYPAIMKYAQHFTEGITDVPDYHLAHFAWEILVIAVNNLFRISFRTSAYLVTLFSIVATALVIYFWLESTLRASGLSLWWGVLAAIGLNLVTPLSLLASIDRKFYLGYIGITSYHNPTIILLRPLALLQFIFALRCFQKAGSMWWQTGIAAAVTLLATFAKPSFAICLLPTMGFVAAYRWLKKQTVHWQLFFFGFIIPTIIMLTWQFLLAYGSPEQSGIFFYPFGVMAGLSGYLGLKFLLSILFPLLIAILFFPEVVRDIRMALAWLNFLFGASYSYFLAEGPPRTLDGNFIWSGKITLLILFCVSTLFLIERIKAIRWKSILLGAVWASQVVSGIVYYYHIFITQKYI
jgi:hypothetical protein